jgi:hypothetical protein
VLHWPRIRLKMNAIIWLRFRCLTLRIRAVAAAPAICGLTIFDGHASVPGRVGGFQSANAVSRRSFLSLCGTATAARLGVISTRKPVAV